MTYEQAHIFLEDEQRKMTKQRYLYNETVIEVNGMAIEAIEKQIPKKTIKYNQLSINEEKRKQKQLILNYYDSERCPVCGSDIWGSLAQKAHYCQNCGQRLEG